MHGELCRVSAENVSLHVKLEGLEGEKFNIKDELRLVKEKCDGLSRDLHTKGAFWRRHLDQAAATQSVKLPLIYKYRKV